MVAVVAAPMGVTLRRPECLVRGEERVRVIDGGEKEGWGRGGGEGGGAPKPKPRQPNTP